jgi:Family of unknown function (DUF6510)
VSATALDGNAVGGLLHDVFGREMTAAGTVCGGCGARGVVGALAVWTRGPGSVVRCRDCDTILMVLVTIRETTCVDLGGLASLDPAPTTKG